MRNDSFHSNWKTQLRKGVLELSILNALRDERRYGYQLISRLREIDGLVVGEGTIYPIMSRLKGEGFLRTSIEESPEGPARKYYHLTPKGRARLEAMNEHWQRLVRGIEGLRETES